MRIWPKWPALENQWTSQCFIISDSPGTNPKKLEGLKGLGSEQKI